jgi:hypothetical protein
MFLLGCLIPWFWLVWKISIPSIFAVLINLEVWIIKNVIRNGYLFYFIVFGSFFRLTRMLRFRYTCSFWWLILLSWHWIWIILFSDCCILSFKTFCTTQGSSIWCCHMSRVFGSYINIEIIWGFFNIYKLVLSIHHLKILVRWVGLNCWLFLLC